MCLPAPFYPILDLDFLQRQGTPIRKQLALYEEFDFPYYQLRAKGLSQKSYFRLARALKKKAPNLQLIANDHLQALLQPEIFRGLHLGQEDIKQLSFEDFSLLQKNPHRLWLGISTHDQNELEFALAYQRSQGILWSYIAMGPCFATTNKANPKPVLLFAELVSMIEGAFYEHVPSIVLIGGLTPEKVHLLANKLKEKIDLKFRAPAQNPSGPLPKSLPPRIVYAGITLFSNEDTIANLQQMQKTGYFL